MYLLYCQKRHLSPDQVLLICTFSTVERRDSHFLVRNLWLPTVPQCVFACNITAFCICDKLLFSKHYEPIPCTFERLQSVNVLVVVVLSQGKWQAVPLILRPGFCFVILNRIFICCIQTHTKRRIACLCCIFRKEVYNQNIVVFTMISVEMRLEFVASLWT